MEAVLRQNVITATQCVEKQLDAELEKLNNLDISDFEKLRENRLKKLKILQQQRQNWISLVAYIYYINYNISITAFMAQFYHMQSYVLVYIFLGSWRIFRAAI